MESEGERRGGSDEQTNERTNPRGERQTDRVKKQVEYALSKRNLSLLREKEREREDKKTGDLSLLC